MHIDIHINLQVILTF